MGEGEEGVVGGEGVPPGGEGGLPRPVPEHSHALALSPGTHTQSDTFSDDKTRVVVGDVEEPFAQ